MNSVRIGSLSDKRCAVAKVILPFPNNVGYEIPFRGLKLMKTEVSDN